MARLAKGVETGILRTFMSHKGNVGRVVILVLGF